MKSSMFILSLLKSDVNAVYYPEAEGGCPFKAGALDSNVKTSLNAHRLAGPWVNLYDRKVLNDDYKCYGVNFIHTHAFSNDEEELEDEQDDDDDDPLPVPPASFAYTALSSFFLLAAPGFRTLP